MVHANYVISNARPHALGKAVPNRRRWRGEFFSLGGLLAPFATSRIALAPWAFSAAFLTALAFSDPLLKGGEVDAILMGLAAYELLIGLTRDDAPASASRTMECGAPQTHTF